MSDADYFRLGDWNIRCDRCGAKMKGSEAVKTWEGYWVHARRSCWEARHPQDFVRGVVEHPTPPFVRNPPDKIISSGDGIVLETDHEGIPDLHPGDDIEYILLETTTWIIEE